MYRLLIVDDEPLVIEGLKNSVAWKNYGIQVVGWALNGQEGINLAQEKKPDIIITDVKMPGLNGLDMIKRINDINPGVKFLVFSGYDDFNLVKRAFTYGATDYMLKPMDLSQLDALLKKLIKEIEKESIDTRDRESIKKVFSESMLILKNSAISGLLTGRYESVDIIKDKLVKAGVEFGDEPFSVLLCLAGGKNGPEDGTGIYLFEDAFAQITAFLEEGRYGYGVILDDKSMAFIVNASGINDQWGRLMAEYIYQKMQTVNINAVIGIGCVYERPGRVKISFIEAEQAVQYSYLFKTPIVCYCDIRSQRGKLEKMDYPSELEKSVVGGLKLSQRELVTKSLDSYFERVRQKKIEIASFKNKMIELLFIVKKEMNSNNIDVSRIFIDEYEEIYSIRDMTGIEEIYEKVRQFVGRIMNYMETTANKSTKQVVHEIMQYIESNYISKEISLNTISDQVYLTPNYISMLVKQETGDNFSDIILKKRIEVAKELLFDASLKTYEISEKVGYSDSSYFIRTFKKYVGMTPGEFRDKFCKE